MEMHQLRYFVAVARTGTFSRVADACPAFLVLKDIKHWAGPNMGE